MYVDFITLLSITLLHINWRFGILADGEDLFVTHCIGGAFISLDNSQKNYVGRIGSGALMKKHDWEKYLCDSTFSCLKICLENHR